MFLGITIFTQFQMAVSMMTLIFVEYSSDMREKARVLQGALNFQPLGQQ